MQEDHGERYPDPVQEMLGTGRDPPSDRYPWKTYPRTGAGGSDRCHPCKKESWDQQGYAPLTVGLGPGFTAGEDVDYVIETMRGHNLGRIIKKGSALPNTGVPGLIAGIGKERVIHSPAAGNMKNICQIADLVEKDQVIACR